MTPLGAQLRAFLKATVKVLAGGAVSLRLDRGVICVQAHSEDIGLLHSILRKLIS